VFPVDHCCYFFACKAPFDAQNLNHMCFVATLSSGLIFIQQLNLALKQSNLSLSVVYATGQHATKTSDSNFLIRHEMGVDSLADHDNLLSRTSAPACDVFCALKLEKNEVVKEGIQCRHISRVTTTSIIRDEQVLKRFLCGHSNRSWVFDWIPHVHLSMIQGSKNTLDHMQAERSCARKKPQTLGHFSCSVVTILEKRKELEFQRLEDCYERTKIPKRVLSHFKF
jgi:hypothetical protein